MASDARLAKLLAHIAACHSAELPGARLPLHSGPHHIGYVKQDLAVRLTALSSSFTRTETALHLAPAALPELNAIALAAGIRVRDEKLHLGVERGLRPKCLDGSDTHQRA